MVIPERRAAGVTATVTKASAGASEHLPIAKVTNIARTLEELKEKHLWIVGLDERGTQTYDTLDYNRDCAIVLGSELKECMTWWRGSATSWFRFPCWGKYRP